MTSELFFALSLAAITVGPLHSLAPDHWVPFAALARARRWSAWRTARMTFLCGLGHVTVSVALGLIAMFAGVRVVEAFGERMESLATIVLIVFGLLYLAWGLRRAAGEKYHGHAHDHYDHVHDLSGTSEWTLFFLFSADPCVAVIPLMFAAGSLGPLAVAGIVVQYEIATIATMILLVLPAAAGAKLVRAKWLDRYGHAAAGAVIVAAGVVML